MSTVMEANDAKGPNCLLVYPKFTAPSFWNYLNTCDLVGAAYPAAPLGLVTVAAMFPENWNCRLIDCNTKELTDEDIRWADLVFSGGMISQQFSHRQLINRVRHFNKIHVVGGPDATSSPHFYAHASHLVLGEAEVTLPRFIKDFDNGDAKHVYYAGEEKADVTTSPIPRYDLLNFKNYLHVGIQFARGCPFNCEFCDIIELFGRIPRMKTHKQILDELDSLYEAGYRGHVDFVDDNFIGNRSAAKKLLPKVKDWLIEHKWPFEFSTEATINLADDDKLLELMQEVGFSAIFVGIESPNEDTLKQTQKGQNTRRSISESIRKIYRYGIFVNAGYIVGFDTETKTVAKDMLDCIKATQIPVNMVGLLTALPNTQLTRRLKKEKRLLPNFDESNEDSGDQCLAGLNFVPTRPRDEILKDYYEVVRISFSPEEYFDRVLNVVYALNCTKKRMKVPLNYWAKDLRGLFNLIYRMGFRAHYRRHFWKVFFSCLIKNPKAMRYGIAMMALYLHFDPFSKYIMGHIDTEIVKAKAAAVASA